jgi:hypothetical protein
MIKNLGADEFFSCERLIRQTQETADFIVKLPYLAIFREKDFPSDCPLDYFRIMDLMARELNQTVHVSRVIIADLVV